MTVTIHELGVALSHQWAVTITLPCLIRWPQQTNYCLLNVVKLTNYPVKVTSVQ
ncbi:MAG: hypothetical protein R2867_10490 [Caldilineaceae bacterium]